jgi:monoamine oxidase
MHDMHSEIAIVGAGLSGLALADRLIQQGRKVIVLEARDRVGGRILSVPQQGKGERPGDHRYDLGPAWIWPHNHRMLALVQRLGLAVMPQHAAGHLVFQDDRGAVRRDYDLSPMAGSLRVEGGLARIPERLAAELPDGTLHLGCRVKRIQLAGRSPSLAVLGSEGPLSLRAETVVLAMPPRLIAERIAFAPALSRPTLAQLCAVPTWMAAQAKVIAVYPTAFWREAGLSGDAISHRGPLVEIHDASPAAEPSGEAALFGFVHPAALPTESEPDRAQDAFRDQVLAQLADLFGPAASSPSAFLVKLWGQDAYTATGCDRPGPATHPVYGPIAVREEAWAGKLLLSGSETGAENGGFLEGALEAAEEAAKALHTQGTSADTLRSRL